MALMVVNPTPVKSTKRRRKAASSQGASTMKRKRTVRRKATSRRRTFTNPAPVRRYRRRARHHNPAPVHYRRRRHRNPSMGGGSIFSELMSKDGLMMIAAVVGTPTLTELAVQYIMPSASGTTKSLVKAGLGFGIAYGVYRFLNKKAGMVVALVSTGSAISDLINAYMSPTIGSSSASAAKVVSGYTRPSGNLLGGYVSEPGLVRV